MTSRVAVRWHLVVLMMMSAPSLLAFEKAEKPLAVVITSYKNKDWYRQNLDSVFSQDYSNYRVIYIDDASPDDTGGLAERYIKERGQEHRVKLIKNNIWLGQMANHYRAAHMCSDHEIVVHIDGDDWLAHSNVFKIISDSYSSSDIWLTHGGAVFFPGEEPWPGGRVTPGLLEEMIAHNTFRDKGRDGWVFSHLRTFYGWLFKQIKLQDLLYEGTFKGMNPTPDTGFMYPLVEMAGRHVKYFTDILYRWNMQNPNSQLKITPWDRIFTLADTIRSWEKYKPCERPIKSKKEHYKASKADVIVLASHGSSSLANCLRSFSYVRGSNKLVVIYDSNASSSMASISKNFPKITFLAHDSQSGFCLEDLIKRCLNNSLAKHVVLCSDTIVIRNNLNLAHCIQELETTFAEAFYLSLAYSEQLVCAPLSDDLLAWQMNYGRQLWQQIEHIGMILYRKQDLENRLASMVTTSIQQFEEMWQHYRYSDRAVGLIFKSTRVARH